MFSLQSTLRLKKLDIFGKMPTSQGPAHVRNSSKAVATADMTCSSPCGSSTHAVAARPTSPNANGKHKVQAVACAGLGCTTEQQATMLAH